MLQSFIILLQAEVLDFEQETGPRLQAEEFVAFGAPCSSFLSFFFSVLNYDVFELVSAPAPAKQN